MAQKVITTLTDDIDGTDIKSGEGETITFALDGVNYEIDLNTKNAKKMRDTLAFYVDHGRRASGARRTTRAARAGSRDYDPAAVRAWAKSNKVDVPARGRIPAGVIEQFRASGN